MFLGWNSSVMNRLFAVILLIAVGLASAAVAQSAPARAPQAGRAARAPDIPPDRPPDLPLSIEEARGKCWMELEQNRKAPRDLVKRSELVGKCAEAKMRAQSQ